MLKTTVDRLIQLLFIIVLLYGNIRCQKYDVTIWGLHVGTAKLQQDKDEDITFILKSNDFIDYVLPINLIYYSKFNKNNYTIVETKKTTEQKTEEQNYEAILKSENLLVYNVQDSIHLEQNTPSLLSLFVRLMNSPVDSIDTKWFNLENEGILYKTRLLWNDTTTILINNENILCDHYRLDLKMLDDDKKLFEKTDYFNELFFDINSVRQIWIEKWQKQQRIIKITIKNNLVNLRIAIKI